MMRRPDVFYARTRSACTRCPATIDVGERAVRDNHGVAHLGCLTSPTRCPNCDRNPAHVVEEAAGVDSRQEQLDLGAVS